MELVTFDVILKCDRMCCIALGEDYQYDDKNSPSRVVMSCLIQTRIVTNL
jgi:hypothetical protein